MNITAHASYLTRLFDKSQAPVDLDEVRVPTVREHRRRTTRTVVVVEVHLGRRKPATRVIEVRA